MSNSVPIAIIFIVGECIVNKVQHDMFFIPDTKNRSAVLFILWHFHNWRFGVLIWVIMNFKFQHFWPIKDLQEY